jgi:sodium-coupled neutral amino acid transporter 11
MVVIVVTVITQGFRVPAESRGDVRGSLFINDGFFQAVGVISFGKKSPLYQCLVELEANL